MDQRIARGSLYKIRVRGGIPPVRNFDDLSSDTFGNKKGFVFPVIKRSQNILTNQANDNTRMDKLANESVERTKKSFDMVSDATSDEEEFRQTIDDEGSQNESESETNAQDVGEIIGDFKQFSSASVKRNLTFSNKYNNENDNNNIINNISGNINNDNKNSTNNKSSDTSLESSGEVEEEEEEEATEGVQNKAIDDLKKDKSPLGKDDEDTEETDGIQKEETNGIQKEETDRNDINKNKSSFDEVDEDEEFITIHGDPGNDQVMTSDGKNNLQRRKSIKQVCLMTASWFCLKFSLFLNCGH